MRDDRTCSLSEEDQSGKYHKRANQSEAGQVQRKSNARERHLFSSQLRRDLWINANRRVRGEIGDAIAIGDRLCSSPRRALTILLRILARARATPRPAVSMLALTAAR